VPGLYRAGSRGRALTAQLLNLAEGAFAGIACLIIPHAIWLVWLLLKRIESGKPVGPYRWTHGGLADVRPVVRAVSAAQAGRMIGQSAVIPAGNGRTRPAGAIASTRSGFSAIQRTTGVR